MLEDFVLQILGQEWLWVIVVLVVVLFGSNKIPELAKTIGRATGEFQKARMQIQKEIDKAQSELNMTPLNVDLNKVPEMLKGDLSKAPEMLMKELNKAPEMLKKELNKAPEMLKKELNKQPERLKLEEAARALGIDPADKTDGQLKEEIKRVL